MAVVEHEVNRHETLVEDAENKRKGGTVLIYTCTCTMYMYYIAIFIKHYLLALFVVA